MLADGDAEIRTGPPTSLTELMRRAHFSAAEFTALNASLRASDRLARLEERVMDEVAPRIAAGVDRAYVGDVAPQYRLLVDDAYHREKGRIMSAIERFTKLVDDRTSARTTDLQARTEKLLVSQTGILVLLGITLLITLGLAARQIARPLARLTAVTRRIAGGDWSERAPADGVAELRELAGDFNDMADAVERDLAGRRRAEHEARDASERLRTIADRVPGAVFQFHVGVDGGLSVRFASRDGSVHGVYRQRGGRLPVGLARGRRRRPRRVDRLDGRGRPRRRAVAPRVPHPHPRGRGRAGCRRRRSASPPATARASSTATSRTSPSARRWRSSCAGRGRQPRAPIARSRRSWR